MSVETTDPAFEDLLIFLRDHRGFDFTGYKRPSLMRRVQRRMDVIETEDFEAYRDYLEVHPDEFAYLFNTILINVSSFFRDREAWNFIAEEIVPTIIEKKAAGGDIRVWSAGCSAGEEPYTLAMVFAEALGVEEAARRLKIYATDVDEDALAQARQGGYQPEITEPIPGWMRDKYFELSGGRYVFRGDLRRAVIFGRHDLIQDAPISRLDLLVCRNTLIYLNAETQRRVLARFHFALDDDGFLFLGRAEMLLTHSHLFRPMQHDYRVFTKVPTTDRRDRMVVLAQAGDGVAADELGTYVRLREAAFGVAPLPQLVIDRRDSLALANEAVRSMFGLRSQDLGRPFQDLEVSYRPVELRGPIQQAKREGRTITVEGVERTRENGTAQFLDVVVTPLREDGGRILGVSLGFVDVTDCHELQDELNRSKEEIETAYEELQSTNEELETTNEELQSTVEELQTTNEELQSTNEEMEAMNEELGTANEELQTGNEQLRQRTEELDRSKAFLESVLASFEYGVVVIDRDFHVLLWNEKAEDLWGLRAEEVEGRSLLSLDIELPVQGLAEPVQRLLAEEETEEQTVQLEGVDRRGRAVVVQVTGALKRGPGGGVDGVILMMNPIAGDQGEG